MKSFRLGRTGALRLSPPLLVATTEHAEEDGAQAPADCNDQEKEDTTFPGYDRGGRLRKWHAQHQQQRQHLSCTHQHTATPHPPKTSGATFAHARQQSQT